MLSTSSMQSSLYGRYHLKSRNESLEVTGFCSATIPYWQCYRWDKDNCVSWILNLRFYYECPAQDTQTAG